jgi:glycosyltransferase involved in cell wall biosynthesis
LESALVPRRSRLIVDGRRLTSGRTGVGRYLECLLHAWANSGLPAHETRVILSDPSGLHRLPAAEGLHAQVVVPRLPGLLWERFGLGRVLGPGDVLFAPTNLVPSHWRGPTVLVMFDALQEVRPGDFPRLVRLRFGSRYRRALRRADRVIVPSSATARDLQRIYEVAWDRMTVIPPAPDPGFRPLPADAPEVRAAREAVRVGNDPFFLFVGKRSLRRNVRAILAAFVLHRQVFPSHRLVFVGQRPGGEPLAPGEGIVDAGYVPEPVLQGLMATALAVLYPSEHEGFGLPVIEAMASGCPVITLRRDALVEAGGDGPFYLEHASPDALARAMSLLTGDAKMRDERISMGLLQAGRFHMEEFASAVRAILQEFL